MQDGRQNLIVALDLANGNKARALVQQLGENVVFYKVGKELFTAEGPSFVRELVAGGKKVFLDLKFHDIPNTVAAAIRSAASLGASLLTVHAAGGSKMLKAAAEAAAQSESKPTVLAVTVLTSLNTEDLREIGVSDGVDVQVARLAALALRSGCGGLVSSAQEAAHLRQTLGQEFTLVTPGVRPPGGAVGDQSRIATPEDAIRAGANYIVVGRPITSASDPVEAAKLIVKQIERTF